MNAREKVALNELMASLEALDIRSQHPFVFMMFLRTALAEYAVGDQIFWQLNAANFRFAEDASEEFLVKLAEVIARALSKLFIATEREFGLVHANRVIAGYKLDLSSL